MNTPDDPRTPLDQAYRRLLRSQLDPGLGIATALAVGLLAMTGLLPVLGAGPGAALLSGTAVAGLWAGVAVRSQLRKANRRADLDLLIAANDPRAAAPLLEELRFHGSRYEGPDAEALVGLLSRVPADDPLFRYRWYQEALHHALREAGDPAVLVALLGAMGRVGDGRGIGYVRILAENAGHFVDDERVAAAAREALPVLRSRQPVEGRESGSLLRPATTPSSDPECLLRITRSAPSSDERLIRPAEQQEASRSA